MEDKKYSSDPSTNEQYKPLDEQGGTLAGAKRENQEHEPQQRTKGRDNAEREPLPIPVEIEQLISVIKRFVIFVRDHENFNAPVVVLTLVIAVATIAQGIASYLQWSSNEKSAEAAKSAALTAAESLRDARSVYRPFMTEYEPTISIDFKNRSFEYIINMQDASQVSATEFSATCEVFLGDRKIVTEPNIRPIIVGANNRISICGGGVRQTQEFNDVVTGRLTLRVYAHGSYKGPTNSYQYCNGMQYHWKLREFTDLGECDASKPFPQ